MKKLILVTLMAVAASWLLSEVQPTGPSPEPVMTTKTALVRQDHWSTPTPTPSDEPGSIRTVPWSKSEPRRPKRAARTQAKSQVEPESVATTGASKPSPSWFPKTDAEAEALAKSDANGSRVLLGRLSASEARARQDLQQVVENEVGGWLSGDVPASWKTPAKAIAAMSQGTFTQEVARSLAPDSPSTYSAETPEIAGLDGLYTLHRAGQKLDFSPGRRASILKLYRKDLAAGRMQRLGGGLAVALVGLAAIAGYIKADEATKGYYTNRLRFVAAAGLGAAGVAAYRYLA